jgi:hypothetical protein
MKESWGEKEKARAKRRRPYFREWMRKKRAKSGGGSISLGYLGEMEALNILQGSIRNFTGIDLWWNGKKVDVKTSSFRTRSRNKHEHYWGFQVRKQIGKCDYFLCLCKDSSGKTQYALLIPEKEVHVKQAIWIVESKIQRWSKYLIKIEEMKVAVKSP